MISLSPISETKVNGNLAEDRKKHCVDESVGRRVDNLHWNRGIEVWSGRRVWQMKKRNKKYKKGKQRRK